MTAINLLLFPLTIAVALLGPRYELRCLDGYWSDTFQVALSYPAISLIAESKNVLNDHTFLPYAVGAAREDDESGD